MWKQWSLSFKNKSAYRWGSHNYILLLLLHRSKTFHLLWIILNYFLRAVLFSQVLKKKIFFSVSDGYNDPHPLHYILRIDQHRKYSCQHMRSCERRIIIRLVCLKLSWIMRGNIITKLLRFVSASYFRYLRLTTLIVMNVL